MIGSLFSWIADPAHWSGSDGILNRLLEHLWYSVLAMVLALVIALPLGLYIGHTGRLRWLVTATNAARAVPTLGLLFAFALWLGPSLRGDLAFLVPATIVLVLLAVPPLLAGTYAGVEAVDPAARDAARGVGMTGWQVLRQVELPCALPLVMSGVRTAALQVVATATIAALIGLGGLGRLLVDGIAFGDYPQAAAGALLVAVLAVLLEGLLALLQRRLVSPGLGGGRGAVGGSRNDDDAAAAEANARMPVGPGGMAGGNS
ncbi:ABC transporter permease [Phycicoccus sonneratiae]|uniref:ABC transporter permease subunit n=1 Tax=Phycicoccus sonneratiae TaxID=2807628 RepID=A0ABS2CP09_9MICO|nr:ABC transporter permease subunit [Phycicoccus sonneraticus]MBM6401614.1 ABC transporter permease subunit [Phycicoccus sonneraticus]